VSLKNLKLTALINAYSMVQIPLLGFITPRVVESTASKSVIRVRLDRRTRNHLGVMYFGALAMGAELSIALKAITEIAESGQKIDFIFKDFSADFLKRADGHVHFVCGQAKGVADLIRKASKSSERLEKKFSGYAIVPANGNEPVMKYTLTLSVRNRPTMKRNSPKKSREAPR
jgi:acyl-coenzyme A thioesterase PaaI-like protein